MPRRRSRYSKLLEDLRTEGGTPPSPGEGDQGRKYNFYKFLLGAKTNKIKQINKVPSGGRKRWKVGLYPFAITPGAPTDLDTRYITYASAYSLKGLEDRVAATKADFGHHPSEEGGKANDAYYPALLKVSYSKSGATADPDKESAITKDTYNYVPKRTFSIPFGRTINATKDSVTGADETQISSADELDVLKSLTTKVKNTTNVSKIPLSVGYDPEMFKNPASTEKDTKQTTASTDFGSFSVE